MDRPGKKYQNAIDTREGNLSRVEFQGCSPKEQLTALGGKTCLGSGSDVLCLVWYRPPLETLRVGFPNGLIGPIGQSVLGWLR